MQQTLTPQEYTDLATQWANAAESWQAWLDRVELPAQDPTEMTTRAYILDARAKVRSYRRLAAQIAGA